MDSYTNTQHIQRRATLGKWLTFGGLGVMVIGLIVSFRQPEQFNLVFLFFILGMLASQVGMPLMNRWGRQPRMDEILDRGLKGLDPRYAVFHYFLGANHALISPAGIFAVVPSIEDGLIEFEDGEWVQTKEKRGFLRRGGTRKLRGISGHLEAEAQALAKAFQREVAQEENLEVPPVKSLLVFVHPDAEVEVTDPPHTTVHIKKLKDTLRSLPKDETFDERVIKDLADKLEAVDN